MRKIALVCIPIVVTSVIGSYVVGSYMVGEKIEYQASLSKDKLLIKKQLLINVLKPLIANTDYLASRVFTQSDFDGHNNESLVRDFTHFLGGKDDYFQLRLIDLDGDEKIRLVVRDGKILNDSQGLQNKSHRRYLIRSMALNKREVFLSRLDLNVENGEVEHPRVPVVRAASPVFDAHGKKLGIVIINYRVRNPIAFIDQSLSSHFNFYLLNKSGYYLYAPEEKKEFAFMFPDSVASSFRYEYPDEWRQIAGSHSSYLTDENGLFVSLGMDLSSDFTKDFTEHHQNLKVNSDEAWFLVEHLSRRSLHGQTNYVWHRIVLFNLFFLVLVGGISIQLGISTTRRIKTMQELARTNHELHVQSKELKAVSDSLTHKNAQLRDFNHILSHNLRAPTTSLRALIGMLVNTKDYESAAVLFPKFQIISQAFSDLVEDLHKTSQVVVNSEVEPENVVIAELVKNSQKLLLANEGESGDPVIEVRTDLAEWQSVLFPKVYLQSVIQNLMSNAIKYRSDQRAPYVLFKTMFDDDNKVLVVEDNGIGIDMKMHGHNLFKLYKRFHKERPGKGMGLFMIKTQLESANAHITVESEPNRGTKFFIKFNT